MLILHFVFFVDAGLSAEAVFDGVKIDLLSATISNPPDPYYLYEHYTEHVDRKLKNLKYLK